MAKIKIGKTEYQIESLDAWDIDHLDGLQNDKETKLSLYKHMFRIYLYAVKKFNSSVDMKLDDFMKSFPLVGIQEKIIYINEVLGLNFTQPSQISLNSLQQPMDGNTKK